MRITSANVHHMAKTDVRITVNLPMDVYEPLKAASDAMGVSMSAVLRDLAESAAPMLAVLEDAALAIRTAPAKHREMLGLLAEEMAGVHTDTDAMLAQVRQIADPRPSNTGVRNDEN